MLTKVKQLYKELLDHDKALREEIRALNTRHYSMINIYRQLGEEFKKILSLENTDERKRETGDP